MLAAGLRGYSLRLLRIPFDWPPLGSGDYDSEMKPLLFRLCAVLSALGIALHAASPPSSGTAPLYPELEKQVKTAIDGKNFQLFEKLVLAGQPANGVLPLCRDGQSQLAAVHGIVQNYRYRAPDMYQRFQAMLDGWHAKKPDSGHWRIYSAHHLCGKIEAEPNALTSVRDWEQCVQLLDEAEKFVGRAPDWYASFLRVAYVGMKLVESGAMNSVPQRFERWNALADEGIRKFPEHYQISYKSDPLVTATHFPGGLDGWTRHVCELLPERGFEPYAKLWWAREFRFKEHLFHKGNADWLTFRDGFYGLLKRYPQSKRLPAKFLEFARLAEDKETTRKLLPQIDNPPSPEAFPVTVRFLEISQWADGTAVERKPIWRYRPGAGAESVAWSKDGESVYAGMNTWQVRILDAQTGKEFRRIALEDDETTLPIKDIAVSPDGKLVAAVDGSAKLTRPGKCRIWRTETFETVATFSSKAGPLNSISWAPDSTRLIVGGGLFAGPGEGWLWNGESAAVISMEQVARNTIRATAWDPLNAKLLFNSSGSQIVVAEHSKQLREAKQIAVKVATSIMSLQFSPDGKWVAAACGGSYYDKFDANGSIALFDANTMEPRKDVAPPETEGLMSVDWSPDGKLIACGGYDGYVYVLDSSTCQIKDFWNLGRGTIHKIRWSPDGKRLAVAEGEGISVWSLD